VNVGVSGWSWPSISRRDHGAPENNHSMDTMRVLVLWLPRAWGLGAVRMVAARTPSPLVFSACHPDQQVTGVEPETSCLQIADHQACGSLQCTDRRP